jgi:hypothetical protein
LKFQLSDNDYNELKDLLVERLEYYSSIYDGILVPDYKQTVRAEMDLIVRVLNALANIPELSKE